MAERMAYNVPSAPFLFLGDYLSMIYPFSLFIHYFLSLSGNACLSAAVAFFL